MKMNKFLFPFATVCLVLFFSCQTEPNPQSEPVQEETTVVEPELKPEPVQEPELVEEETFEVSQDLYNKTFDEVDDFITAMDRIIAMKDFDSWMSNLSETYIYKYSNEEFLKEKSESPILKMDDIVLKDIEDYFKHVVVSSRMSLNLEEIEFDDENHVTAWTIFNDNRAILYQLELIDNTWKISTW